MKETTFSTTTPDYRKLVTNLNYNFAESPSTQTYHNVAAYDNPDYAQAIGDIYRWGDVNRANFNLNLDYITDLNNKQYLDAIQKEQRAYAKQLRDEQRAYNEKQQAKAWARADAKAKEARDQALSDKRFQLALALLNRQQKDPRNIAEYTPYRTNNTNISTDLDQLAQERQDLINAGNNLFTPENLTGNSPNEILYNALMAEKQHQQNVADYNKKANSIRSDYQEDLLQNAANNSYLTGMFNISPWNHNRAEQLLSNNDDRSYAAKLISEDPFLGLTHQTKEAKSQMLNQFMRNYNAVSVPGWDTDLDTKVLQNILINLGYDTTSMAPLYSGDTDTNYIYDNNTSTIYELAKDDNTEQFTLVPVQKLDNPHKFSLGRLFKNVSRDTGASFPLIKSQRPDNFGE